MPIDLDTLSPREREIVARLARGDAQKAIAADLGISDSAVEIYIARAKVKLGAVTVIHLAVIFAVESALYRQAKTAA